MIVSLIQLFPGIMSQTTEKRSRFWRFGGWIAELILVFVGVYAAFWLNNYQQHQQDTERRDRILASIERTLRDGIATLNEPTRNCLSKSEPNGNGNVDMLGCVKQSITS